jgi:hypothetical protein
MIEATAVGFLFMAAWCWWKALRALVRGRLSRAWPTTNGVILAARVVKKRNSKAREVWRHELQYSYSVAGEAYRGSRVRFGVPNAFLWLAPSDPSFQRFRRGARVAVHHSPSRPSVSALQTGVSPFAYLTLACGGVSAWMGFRLLTLPG